MFPHQSQGQTLGRVGVWLQTPVFTHGQLYVASSRTSCPSNLTFAIKVHHILQQDIF